MFRRENEHNVSAKWGDFSRVVFTQWNRLGYGALINKRNPSCHFAFHTYLRNSSGIRVQRLGERIFAKRKGTAGWGRDRGIGREVFNPLARGSCRF